MVRSSTTLSLPHTMAQRPTPPAPSSGQGVRGDQLPSAAHTGSSVGSEQHEWARWLTIDAVYRSFSGSWQFITIFCWNNGESVFGFALGCVRWMFGSSSGWTLLPLPPLKGWHTKAD